MPSADQQNRRVLGSSVGEVAWSPQANALVVVAGSPKDQYHYDLWRIDLSGSAQELTTLRGYVMEPAFSWDGRRVVFVGDQTGAPHRGFGMIYSERTAGGDFRTLGSAKE